MSDEKTKVRQEIDEAGMHRLICGQASTRWAGYRQICLLQNMVGYTGFYSNKEGVCTQEEFCKMIAVGEDSL